jgi:type II secretory pathway component PulK
MFHNLLQPRGVPQSAQSRPRKGVVLLMVLVVVVLMTLAAYQFSDSMMSESKASDNNLRSAQARAFANSGIQYAAVMLSDPTNFTSILNSNPYNNPSVFGQQVVQSNDSARFQGRFSLLARLPIDDPGITGSQPYTFGTMDESAKININAIMQNDPSGQTLYNMLVLLPNMTPDIANAICDWVDVDDQPRDGGAESDTYGTKTLPYQAKNAPLDSVEELLLVQGVSYQFLFGNDYNRNGTLDPGEDNGSGQHDRGWSEYLTVYSKELNVDSQGNPRIYVNSSDLNTLYTNLSTVLSADLATYIILYRMYGPSTTTTSSGGSGGKGVTPAPSGKTASAMPATSGGGSAAAATTGSVKNLNRNTLNLGTSKGGTNISSLYSLINSQVTVPSADGKSPGTIYPSPLSSTSGNLQTLLPLLLDGCTTSQKTTIPGRINVNTAPLAVLSCLPYLQETDVQNILAMRPQSSSIEAPDPIFQTPAWLIVEANISPTTMAKLDKYITTRTQVYRVQSVGYFDQGGPSARIEAVIDTNGGQPRILYWRDLTELGKGFDFPVSQ